MIMASVGDWLWVFYYIVSQFQWHSEQRKYPVLCLSWAQSLCSSHDQSGKLHYRVTSQLLHIMSKHLKSL